MRCIFALAAVLTAVGVPLFAAEAPVPPLSALARMPIREVTIFKNGMVVVNHEGRMPVDADGTVRLDYLPQPIMGAFWPYSADKAVRLSSVTAGVRRVVIERTGMSVRDMIEANPGATAIITDTTGQRVGVNNVIENVINVTEGTILGLLTRSGAELEATSLPGAGIRLPEKSTVLLLKTADGVTTLDINRIVKVTFKGDFKQKLTSEEFRNVLTLHVEGAGAPLDKTARVGMAYVQSGIRWIPSYRVSVDGAGNATIRLQATLINELDDLNDVDANLVVGVPSFAFAGTPDPISLQNWFAQRSGGTGFNPFGNNNSNSNAIMTQVPSGANGEDAGKAPQLASVPNLGPDVVGGSKDEDFYVYHARHISLKKGERMNLPVAEYTAKYRDIYKLDIPEVSLPRIVSDNDQVVEEDVQRAAAAPNVTHRIRLMNRGLEPFTTAPVLLLSGEQVLAQGTMLYTPSGADTDITMTTAVDIKVTKTDRETKRDPMAAVWQQYQYGRVDLVGAVSVSSFRDKRIDLEVNRYVPGAVDKVEGGGKSEMLNTLEGAEYIPLGGLPDTGGRFNAHSRIVWNVKVEPGKPLDLGYSWHYFWRGNPIPKKK